VSCADDADAGGRGAPPPAGAVGSGTVFTVTIAEYEETVIPLGPATPAVAELAQRARAHERIRLVAADGASVVVMSEDDLDQALQDAMDVAQAKAILAAPDPAALTGAAALSWLDEVAASG